MRLLSTGEGNTINNCHVDDVLHHINQALRELYSNYAYKQIKENNEIVLINPFYETTDSVRQVLSDKAKCGPDVSKHEKEGGLVIADSLEEYIGKQPHINFEEFSELC